MDSTAATDVAIMETREASPAHLLIKIESFSLFEKHGIEKFETSAFEAGGYNWKLSIYPNGREIDEGYVSVYLAIVDFGGLPAGWEIVVSGISRRFLAMKREWGFPKFISKIELNDPHNGYLSHDDNCVFGAEVFVNENYAVIERVSLKNVVDAPYKREWIIPNFSKSVIMYRNGIGDAIGRFLSLFLIYIPMNGNIERLHTCYTIRMMNQLCTEHESKVASNWFSPVGESSWGWLSFIELDAVNDPNEGFIVNDCCIIEVEISVQAIASSYLTRLATVAGFAPLHSSFPFMALIVAPNPFPVFMLLTAAIMETREASPAHFLVKIKSFSLFEKHEIKKFKTREFEAGGYKKLKIYPNGRDKDEGFVSVYLAIVDDGLPAGWEVNAVFTICLFNQISCNYRYSQVVSGKYRRFLAMKTKWGFLKFISKTELNDPHNGYLSHDNCVFGAEVFVKENKAMIDCLSLKNVVDAPYKREWNIPNFSKLGSDWVSPECVRMYRNGYGEASGRYLSIFLHYIPTNGNNERLHTCFTIRMKNQLSSKLESKVASNWFSAPGNLNWGWASFIELAVVNDPNKGFVVNDCCIIQYLTRLATVAGFAPLHSSFPFMALIVAPNPFSVVIRS
ncbi:TRAF-like family protein [Striga asiatica]|uniref:TRAF-like family protein n=1 Tax=Striga asiatica TaxID=4170 RepID=A0A5A7Q5W0_STRAF|nr:TRAF-like family protein [Striga asiatica]